jgi:DNA adenine methylase
MTNMDGPCTSNFGDHSLLKGYLSFMTQTVVALPQSGRNDDGTDVTSHPQPILRWAGGKRYLIQELLSHLPTQIEKRRYHEPFLGAGSLFFALNPQRAVLADANEHLVRCYEKVRDDPDGIAIYLREHARRTGEKYFYQVRRLYNSSSFSTAQAARFVYLNRTCFNGIFRVNRQGEFNVPYGWKEPPPLPDRTHLREAGTALEKARLHAVPFEESLKYVRRNDFVYLDPPYPPLNGTANFTHYTADRFDTTDQARLAFEVRRLADLGALFMMSNADTHLVRRLYRGFAMTRLKVTRFITCKAVKHAVRELLITNYDVGS